MADNRLGAGHFVFGAVVNRKDDPTQTGRCRVRWNIGGINQAELGDNDLPWSKSIFPTGNASRGGMGGPHTGFQEGTSVYGFSPSGDGQDIIILGSTPSAGNATPGGSPTFDSDIPAPAKSQNNGTGGGSQPRYGDRNGVVTQQSIWKYGEQEGGPDKKPSLYPQIDEPIGTYAKAITYESA